MPPKRNGKKAASEGKKAAPQEKGQHIKGIRKTGFLDLLAELRNDVYHLTLIQHREVLVPDRKEAVTVSNQAGKDRPPIVFHEPALLATCRQVRSEALQVFYASNTFDMKFALYGPKFVKQLGPERTVMLTAIKVCGAEQATRVTKDRFIDSAIKHANHLLEAADGSLRGDAVLMPVGHAAVGGWEKLTDSESYTLVEAQGKMVVEWAGDTLNPTPSIFDWYE